MQGVLHVCNATIGHAVKPAIAQLVEHLTVDSCSNQMVPGSIPGGRIFQLSADAASQDTQMAHLTMQSTTSEVLSQCITRLLILSIAE